MIPIANVELGEGEVRAAAAVLESGRLTQGPKVEEFEQKFAEKVGAQYAIAVSSGTAALHIAYLATIQPSDEVLVPAFSHISTASMVCLAGGKPMFCDIRSDTFTIDLADAGRRLTKKAKVIAPVHIFGNACKVDEIITFAFENGLRIIWDAAQAHGTKYKGKDVGRIGDLVCYSFYATKTLVIGEGGMITASDPILAQTCRLLRSHGQTSKYFHSLLGLNYRMTEMQAAIGIVQLDRLDDNVGRRRENARLLTKGLVGTAGIVLPVTEVGAEHSYHQYAILVGSDRDRLAERLKEKGVETAVHYPRPLHKQPIFCDSASLSVAENVCSRILSLPIHPKLARGDLEEIVQAVKDSV